MNFYRLLISLLIINCSLLGSEEIGFNKDIRPLLTDRCFSCHGPDERARKAQLRLDTFEGATKDLGGYAAIIPGDPDNSELLLRAIHEDPDEVMPPKKSKIPKLNHQEINIIKKWIKNGAKYQKHWAFTPLNKPKYNSNNNLIDEFIEKRLKEENLQFSNKSDPNTLIRRVYLDLTGLLPSPKEIRSFVENNSNEAYINIVNKLLDSPHYGERWGRHWLDQARYADSHGYTSDSERQMWPFRDWVISALNEDMGFDQFTIEQIAGDLLTNPTKKQIAATAFHRNTLISQEGGSDPEQLRVEAYNGQSQYHGRSMVRGGSVSEQPPTVVITNSIQSVRKSIIKCMHFTIPLKIKIILGQQFRSVRESYLNRLSKTIITKLI